jgi:folate-binding protein YgfZ
VHSSLPEHGFYSCSADYGLVEVYGPDAARFLQAQTTNDIHELAEGSSQVSCLLDRKAHVEAYFQIYRKHQSYRILAETEQIPKIITHLESYKFADKVEFVDWSKTGKFFLVQGHRARSVLDAGLNDTIRLEAFVHYLADLSLWHCPVHAFRKSLVAQDGFFLWVTNSDHSKFCKSFEKVCNQFGLTKFENHDIEKLRVEIGVPKFGVDFDSNNFLPETALDQLCVSYTKGCFLGQEVLARVRSQGSPTRGLVGLLFPENQNLQFERDAALLQGGKEVGWLRSNVYSEANKRTLALGFVVRDLRVPDSTIAVTIDGAAYQLRVTTLPFFKPETAGTRARRLYEEALQVFAREDEQEKSRSKVDSRSVQLLRESLDLDPFLEDAYESLGVILSKRGNLEEAIQLMKKLAELNPDSVMAHTNLSVFYLEKGLKEEAEEEKAISMSIRMKMAAHEAMANSQKQEQATAERQAQEDRLHMFEQVLQIDSEDLLANYGAGSCYVALGEPEKALAFLKRALAVKPTHTVAYLSLAEAYENLSKTSEAVQTYKEGIAVASKRGDLAPMQEMQLRLARLESAIKA